MIQHETIKPTVERSNSQKHVYNNYNNKGNKVIEKNTNNCKISTA